MDPDTASSQSTSGPSGASLVTRQYLFDRICSFNLPSIEEKVNFLKEDLLSSEEYHEDQITSFKQRFAHFKSEIKKYRERKTEAEKNIKKEAKFSIQKEFREKTGLLVVMPKANFGNTNDGDTSRRFFEDPKLASDITRIDYNLIYRLKVILEVISSGYPIDFEKYDKYAVDTARLYKDLYDWHPMTPTMHKILMHGLIMIKNALVPIGQLSEEAAEDRNKHFRNYRQNFARKFSRESCNRDILNRLLLSSYPLISSMKYSRKSNKKSFCPKQSLCSLLRHQILKINGFKCK